MKNVGLLAEDRPAWAVSMCSGDDAFFELMLDLLPSEMGVSDGAQNACMAEQLWAIHVGLLK